MNVHIARLPSPPPGANAIWRSNFKTGHTYLAKEAKDWKRTLWDEKVFQKTGLLVGMLPEMFKWPRYTTPDPQHPYAKLRWFCTVQNTFYTQAHDVDAANKLALDTALPYLGINDSNVYILPAIKVPVESEVDEGLEIVVTVSIVKDRRQAAEIAQKLSNARLHIAWLRENYPTL